MSKFLTVVVMAVFSTGLFAGNPTIKYDFHYEVDTYAENDEVYEFTPLHDKSKFCIVYIIDSIKSVKMVCLPKASPAVSTSPGKPLRLQKLDDYYELDTRFENSEVYMLTPKSNPAYRCMVFALDNNKSHDMFCELKNK